MLSLPSPTRMASWPASISESRGREARHQLLCLERFSDKVSRTSSTRNSLSRVVRTLEAKSAASSSFTFAQSDLLREALLPLEQFTSSSQFDGDVPPPETGSVPSLFSMRLLSLPQENSEAKLQCAAQSASPATPEDLSMCPKGKVAPAISLSDKTLSG